MADGQSWNRRWLHYTILYVASLLTPRDQRAEWVKEWQSELWYIPEGVATQFCLGAFHDALRMKRNHQPTEPTIIHLESPAHCLAFLATLAAVSLFISYCLLGPLKSIPLYAKLGARDLPIACILTLMLSCILLPGTLAVGRAPANHHLTAWPNRLCAWIFLALKIVLVQPILICGFMAWIVIAKVAPFAPLVFLAAFILALRWVLTDQWSRCPVCLRLLTNPVRIGTVSETFLEWYGAESTCSRGHGLMHTSEISASYYGRPQWVCLDDSWSGLFSESTDRGQRR